VLTEQRDHISGYEVDFGKDDMLNEIVYAKANITRTPIPLSWITMFPRRQATYGMTDG